METNNKKNRVIHGEVSSVGPLQFKRDGTVRRVLTIKVHDVNENRYVGAYLVGEDATDGVIRLGMSIVVSYIFTSANELIIIDYYFE